MSRNLKNKKAHRDELKIRLFDCCIIYDLSYKYCIPEHLQNVLTFVGRHNLQYKMCLMAIYNMYNIIIVHQ